MILRGRRVGHECGGCGRWFYRKALVGGECPRCREAARVKARARSSQCVGSRQPPQERSPGG